jgi:adenosylhomocysteine nucleosidase
MPSELRPLVAPLRLVRRPDFFRGSAGRTEVVAARTGIGMGPAARCAARVLDAASPDHLLVVGIAGGIGASVSIGDLITPELVLDLATGETLRPTPLGGRAPRGTLASSDALLASTAEAEALARRGVIAIDMETAAIGAVCARRGCPWSVFRAISDRADDGTTDAAVFGLVGPDGRPSPSALARFLLTRPRRIPQLFRLAHGARTAAHAAAAAAVAALAEL